MLAQPRKWALRGIMFNHLYHHRGHLSVYLRLAGHSRAGDLRRQRRRESVSVRDGALLHRDVDRRTGDAANGYYYRLHARPHRCRKREGYLGGAELVG